MDEIQHLATLLKTDPDNLNGWHRLSQLVDDPQRKRDCQNQITRLENKSRGFDEIVPCENCETWMLIYDDHRKRQKAATCLSCGAQKVLETYEQDAITIWVSTASILAGNLIPVIYVLFFNWDVGSLIILYWIESLIIGFYTVLKLRLIKASTIDTRVVEAFGIVYGLSCFVLGMILLSIFYPTLSHVASRRSYFIEIIWPILGLFINYGISFIQNRKEYVVATLKQIMWPPYVRFFSTFLAVGCLAEIIKNYPMRAVGLLILFFIFKIVAELLLELRILEING